MIIKIKKKILMQQQHPYKFLPSSRQECSGEWRVETCKIKGAAGEWRVESEADFSLLSLIS
jgi:hypothetical protein